MSLVNDLLIESERRRNESRPARSVRLDDLVPARGGRRTHSRRHGLSVAALGFSVVASIVAVASWLPIPAPRPESPPSSTRATPGNPPPVAARPAEEPSPRAPEVAGLPTALHRPVRVESVALERTPTSTTLRFMTDGRTPHRIERDVDSARLDLILSATSLVGSRPALDLLETPIRSLDLRDESPDLHVALELDANVQTQTRWLDVQDGAILIVDLQTAQEPLEAIEAIGTNETLEIETLEDAWVAPRDPDFQHVDQTIPAALGDPEVLRIERSERDRARESRATKRAATLELLESARRARAEGRLDEAHVGFAEFVRLAPNEPAALIEWSGLLVELGRPQEALTLVEGARAQSPRDAALLITHARLLEKQGELPLALELLEQSGLTLTEAPDVHAIAAAYHQRSGDHTGAIERYERILRRFPEESRGWMGLGISLEAVGRRTEARDVYRIALQVGELPGGTRRWISARLSALDEKD